MPRLHIILPGQVRPKGSYRPIRTTTGTIFFQSNQKGAWLLESREALGKAWGDEVPLLEEPVQVSLTFRFVPPKALKQHSYAYKTAPAQRGDLDKLCRAILDILTGTVLRDDKWVIRLNATKEWGERDEVELSLDGANIERSI